MHIVTLTYTADLAAIDAALAEHRDWLDRNFADGAFLASGPQQPRTGGVILCAGIARDELDRRLADDPFRRRSLAEYAITTVTFSRYSAGLELLTSADRG